MHLKTSPTMGSFRRALISSIVAVATCLSVTDAGAAPPKGPQPSKGPLPPACKFDKAVYESTNTVSATSDAVAGAAGLLWLDSYGRILKAFPAGSSISFKLDCPTTRFNYIAAVDATGKKLAESSFIVTPDIPYWDDYEVWMYGGATTPHGADYNHERACNMDGTELAYNWTKPDGAAANNLRWYREWCVPKYKIHYEDRFQKGYWAAFMTAHRNGDLADPAAERKMLVRPDCLSDPKFIEECKQYMRESVSIDAKFRSGAYSISDEPSVTSFSDPFDWCFRPETMQAFRLWAKEKYKTLDALNAEWGTAFKTWDEVVPQTTNEARSNNNPKYRDLFRTKIAGLQIRERNLLLDELAEPGKENYAAWSDHREFMDTAYANLLGECTKVVREGDPHSPAGILGTQGPSAFGGWDYWKLVNAVDWFEPYESGNSWEIVMSWRQPRTVVSQTTFIKSLGPQRYHAASYFLKGSRGAIVYEPGDVFKKDQIISPILAAMRLTWGELRGGLAKLRYRLTDLNQPIGVYYNQASRRVSWLFDAETDGTTWPRRFSSWDGARASLNNGIGAVLRAVQDNGFQAKVVAEQQAVDGELVKQQYKVLFLARIEALSEAEAKALRAYVEAGGILVTDGALGTMDPQCKRRDKGLLDDLCGVKHADFRLCERDGGYYSWNSNPLVKTDAAAKDPLSKQLLANVDVSLLYVSSPGLRAAGGTPLLMAGETPALIVNRVGKGLVLCANVYWADYLKKRSSPTLAAPLLNLVGNILAYAELKPHYEVYEREGKEAKASGKVPPFLQRYFWQEGPLQYLAFNVQGTISQDSLGAVSISGVQDGVLQPLSVKLPKKAYVYNPLTGDYFGETDLAPVDLDTFGFAWLSLLPYKVREIKVDRVELNPAEPLLVNYQAAVKASTGTVGTHILHLDVLDPDGNLCDYHARNLIAEGGKVAGSLRLSQNGKAGTWTLRFRDVATGVTGDLAVHKESQGLYASALPVYDAIQNGKLFGQIKGPIDLRREGNQFIATMQVMVWSEGMQNPKGKVELSVNAPWRLQNSQYDLAEQIAKLQGEFVVPVTCPGSTKLDETTLDLTAKVTCADGRTEDIKGPDVKGAKLAQMIEAKAPIGIEFSSYYEDMNRLTIKDGTLSHTVPYTVEFSGDAAPAGKVVFSVSDGWSIEPKELDLAQVIQRQRGEGLVTVTGPMLFKEEPVVTIAVTTKDGVTKQASRPVVMTYAFRTKAAPVLDGTLDEECWQKARLVTQFHPEGSSAAARYPTTFKVCYDDQNLYVGVEVKGLDPEKMKVTPPRTDGKADVVWGEESMEIFIDPTQRAGKIPYQLIMNYLGKKQSALGEDERWHGKWDVKGSRTKDGYILEMAVPFSTLNTQMPKPNEIWAFNPYRDTVAPFPEFHGQWSVCDDSRASSFYGRLFFLP